VRARQATDSRAVRTGSGSARRPASSSPVRSTKNPPASPAFRDWAGSTRTPWEDGSSPRSGSGTAPACGASVFRGAVGRPAAGFSGMPGGKNSPGSGKAAARLSSPSGGAAPRSFPGLHSPATAFTDSPAGRSSGAPEPLTGPASSARGTGAPGSGPSVVGSCSNSATPEAEVAVCATDTPGPKCWRSHGTARGSSSSRRGGSIAPGSTSGASSPRLPSSAGRTSAAHTSGHTHGSAEPASPCLAPALGTGARVSSVWTAPSARSGAPAGSPPPAGGKSGALACGTTCPRSASWKNPSSGMGPGSVCPTAAFPSQAPRAAAKCTSAATASAGPEAAGAGAPRPSSATALQRQPPNGPRRFTARLPTGPPVPSATC
jgi:hypothetical protein